MIDISKLNCPTCLNKLDNVKNKFNCSICNFEYFHNVASASVAIIEKENKILLLKRSKNPKPGKLHLPGGFVSSEETAEEALRREVKEETNLNVNKINYLFSIPNKYIYSNISYNVLDLYFAVKVSHHEVKIDSESTAFAWISKNSIDANKIAFSSVRNALKRLGYL